MKLKFLPILFMSILALTACSDDDDDRVVRPVETAKHFTGNDLDLKFSGEKLIGKDVLFTPDENDVKAATLTFTGEKFNLESAMNGSKNDGSGYATSSVFAGEESVSFPITMELTGDLGVFGGSGESKYYTFDYTGSVIENKLEVAFTNVVLKNNPIANTSWKVAPVKMDDFGMEIISAPFVIEWKADKMIAIDPLGMGFPMDMSVEDILKLTIAMPLIKVDENTTMTIQEAICMALQNISFENDGNLKAAYMDMNTKKTAISPYGVAQYVVEGDKIKLVLNPFAIAANAKKDNAQTEENPMAGVMQALTPMILESINVEDKLVKGVDITYVKDGDKMTVYVDETLILPVLKVLSPMLENEDMIKAAVEMMKQKPEFATFAPTMEAVLKALPEVINTTTSMKIGLNLIPAAN